MLNYIKGAILTILTISLLLNWQFYTGRMSMGTQTTQDNGYNAMLAQAQFPVKTKGGR